MRTVPKTKEQEGQKEENPLTSNSPVILRLELQLDKRDRHNILASFRHKHRLNNLDKNLTWYLRPGR